MKASTKEPNQIRSARNVGLIAGGTGKRINSKSFDFPLCTLKYYALYTFLYILHRKDS